MIFVLGALSAGLLMLLFLPAFWRRAIRLATRRLEMQMPLSMTEIVAERDQLRAEFAAERRKLEQNSEKLAADLARERAQLGVRTTKIIVLGEELAAVGAENRRAQTEVEQLQRGLFEIETERAVIEKVHYDTVGTLDRRTAHLDRLKQDHAELMQLSDEQRMTIAGLETRVSGLELDLADERATVERLGKSLSEKISLAEFLEHERDQFRSDAASAHQRREKLAENLAGRQSRVEELETELRGLRREQNKLADEILHLKDRIEIAAEREERLKQQTRAQAQSLEAARQEFADRIEAERSSQSILQGALDTVRRENQTLRGELADLKRHGESAKAPAPAPGVADLNKTDRNDGQMLELRQAIAELGTDIIRMTEHVRAANAMDAPGLSPDARDLSARVEELHRKVKSAAGAS